MIISETLAVVHPCLLFLLAVESPKMTSFSVFGRSRFRIFWVDEVCPCLTHRWLKFYISGKEFEEFDFYQ